MVRFLSNNLKLKGLEILANLDGLRFEDLVTSRRRMFKSRVVRGILLDHETSPANRLEMFRRINNTGVDVNPAELRQGALPGPMMELITELSQLPTFIELTPLTKRNIVIKEREELVTRFVVYTFRANADGQERIFEGYHDRPANYLFDGIKDANAAAKADPSLVEHTRGEFVRMLEFVDEVFPNGFRKPDGRRTVPRARYEAISIGTALALREAPELYERRGDLDKWNESAAFVTATTSEGANTRAKLEGRVGFVRDGLLEKM